MLITKQVVEIEGYVYSIMHDESDKPSHIHINNPYTGKNSVIIPIDSIKKVLELANETNETNS